MNGGGTVDRVWSWARLAAQVGFPVAVSMYLLLRLDATLQQLVAALNRFQGQLEMIVQFIAARGGS